MEKRDLIWMYCGLNYAQYDDLTDAVQRVLVTMNGARRMAMKELINKDLTATELGVKLYERGVGVLEYDTGEPDSFARIVDTAKAARMANKWSPEYFKYCSADFKLFRSLAQNPGLHWQFLTTVYGFRTLHNLQEAGLICRCGFDDCQKWGWYTLSPKIINLLDDLNGLA